jgi:hypothetical protein
VAGWLLVAVLGIIWGASLLPLGRFRASSSSSVEEFERSMDLLAETQRRSPGRWVVMPRKGARFTNPKELGRARLRRRRKQILAGLAEATALFFLIGLFPPLHSMLFVALGLLAVLLLYASMLARVRAAESARADAIAARRAREGSEPRREPVAAVDAPPPVDELAVVERDVHVIVHRSDEVDLQELRVAAAGR